MNQFQLLGASCLFLASKFKAIDSIRSIEVVDYTDHAYTVRELKVGNYLVLLLSLLLNKIPKIKFFVCFCPSLFEDNNSLDPSFYLYHNFKEIGRAHV